MKRILVYSHDTFGMGNIRRMLLISEHLVHTYPDLNILIISGSPVLESFRIPPRTDYIKLPGLRRDVNGRYQVNSLDIGYDEAVALRAEIIRSAVSHYQPELVLVDKKPMGVDQELHPALEYASTSLPHTRFALLLRDVLDEPQRTIEVWEKNGYHDAIRKLYDTILVVGSAEVFDVGMEYRFPRTSSDKLLYCGYIRRPVVNGGAHSVRQKFAIEESRPVVLVTAGGGEDGCALIESYLAGLDALSRAASLQPASLIVLGPEMPEPERHRLRAMAVGRLHVHVTDFSRELLAFMQAADVVVAMGGYNTVCEILSLRKRAVIVPRVTPVREQLIRAERLARRGLVTMIHPDELDAQRLAFAVRTQLERDNVETAAAYTLDFDGLPRIAAAVGALLQQPKSERHWA